MTQQAPVIQLTREQLKEVVEEAVKSVFANPDFHCRYRVPTFEHDKQHEALGRLLITMEKVESVRWDILKTVLRYIAVGLLFLLGYGIFSWVLKVLGIASFPVPLPTPSVPS